MKKNNFCQFLKAYPWWENWGVHNEDNFLVPLCLLIVLMGGCVSGFLLHVVKAFTLQKRYSEHFFLKKTEPRETFTDAIKNIFSFDSLFCNILISNLTLKSSIKIASKFHNKYTFQV